MTSSKSIRSGLLAGTAMALAAMGFAGAAQARDNVSFSVGIGVPGVQVGVSNAYPVYGYPQQVLVQAPPVYMQPSPVYMAPVPVYYGQPVYVAPQPVYYGRPHGHHKRHGGGYYGQAPHPGYGPAYAPVYYRR